ncbi:hypothetical protein G3A56_14740 [Rhizobium oryzihabitans]|uniref:Uncharacterized protein n=1 Tax=Rhizobium oryzihabitans TaxID=2267833 RepID=A0A7L5BJU2_9HYPH|nr:hypothetical protein [Rhizobium oryzihabitans]QCM05533.1 hypothetical protein CFBP6626_09785 [Agrobacterium tumefaciens]QIB39102.1 hypothetical protein G3A56_14740 [Rhizobium oryzihabitans]WKL19128.1 hypothetical protein QYR00_08530 [Agrobacterium tumefaciens]
MDEIHPFGHDIFLFLRRAEIRLDNAITAQANVPISLMTHWLMGSLPVCHANEYPLCEARRTGVFMLHLSRTACP